MADAMTSPIRRRTTEQLLADAEERLRVTATLPERLAGIRGTATSPARDIQATVDTHGALRDLSLDESALAAGPERLGEEIVRVAAEAQLVALRQSVTELGDALGDDVALESLRSTGLGADPDAPVLPYVPGVDPNAHRWNVIPPS
jgi:hypothetical protein